MSKRGTITPEGNAGEPHIAFLYTRCYHKDGPDMYRYACDTPSLFSISPTLASTFRFRKTEKKTMELAQLCLNRRNPRPIDCDEHALNFGFLLTDETGNAFELRACPSLIGLRIFGTRCFSFDSRKLITPNNSCLGFHGLCDPSILCPPALPTALRCPSRIPALDRAH